MPDVVGLYNRFGVAIRVPDPPPEHGWVTVRCFAPGHHDRHASARVHLRSGGFRCFSCFAGGGALDALELLGVRDRDEARRLAIDYGILDPPTRPRKSRADFPTPPTTPVIQSVEPVIQSVSGRGVTRGEHVDYDTLADGPAATRDRTWVYVDEHNTPVGRVRRLDLPGGGKRIWQERPDGDQWLTGLNGAELPLYQLPTVIERARRGDRVLIVEGEKACDALDRLGVFATTNAAGAGKWKPEHTATLAGATVAVICDSDLAGRLHAATVTAAALTAGVDALMPLDLFELRNDGSDVVDYLAAVAATCRAVSPDMHTDELRSRLRGHLERQLAHCMRANPDALQRFIARARYTADPAGKLLTICSSCGQERPHTVSHGIAFCPCGAHQALQ